MKKYLWILVMVLLLAICGCQANMDENNVDQQENNLPNSNEIISDTGLPDRYTFIIRSLDQIDYIKSILNEEGEAKSADEVLYLEGIGYGTKEDLIHFLELINNLPTLNLIEGEVSTISYSKGLTEGTEKEYEFAYISIKADDGSWVRFEYLLNKDISATIDDIISSAEEGVTIFSEPVKFAEGKVEIFTKQSQEHPSGVGNLFTWNASINGINTRVIYYTIGENQLNTEEVFSGVNVSIYKHESNYYIFGKLYREMHSNRENSKDNIAVVAKYDGQEILADVVEYQRKLNEFSDEETAQKYDTDIEIVNAIIEQMMLVEEAKRLGYTVTQEDIEAMVDSAKRAYSFPDGKEKVDEYCAGAGITLDEYYDLLRKDYPDTIMKNRLLNSVMKEYCEKNGIKYTQFNLPEEVLAAKQEFIDDLFQRNQHKIEYFIDTDSGT